MAHSETPDIAPADSLFDLEEWFRHNPFVIDDEVDPSSFDLTGVPNIPGSIPLAHQLSGSQGK